MSIQIVANSHVSEICARLDATAFCEIKGFIETELESGQSFDDLFLAISVNASSVVAVAARSYPGNRQEAALFMLATIATQVQAVLSAEAPENSLGALAT